jgi:predicted nucleic acid-binding Zn ribbon protein
MNPQPTRENKLQMKPAPPIESSASVHCPICTHTVPATVLAQGKIVRVKPGQKCPRCSSALDAAYVLRFDRAA